MAVRYARLGGPVRPAGAGALLYLAEEKTRLTMITVTNTGASSRTFAISAVPDQGEDPEDIDIHALVVADTRLVRDFPIAAHDTIPLPFDVVLELGDFLVCSATHSDIIIRADGLIGVP